MGTRHRQMVINKAGNLVVNQYGQWDGYPEGQGVDILNFLKSMDIDKYDMELSMLRQGTEEDFELVPKDGWQKDYPYLSRDCGAEIHQLIQDGKVKFVHFYDGDDRWIEGEYVNNLADMTFTSKYHDHKVVFDINNLPSKEKFVALASGKEYEMPEDNDIVQMFRTILFSGGGHPSWEEVAAANAVLDVLTNRYNLSVNTRFDEDVDELNFDKVEQEILENFITTK